MYYLKKKNNQLTFSCFQTSKITLLSADACDLTTRSIKM